MKDRTDNVLFYEVQHLRQLWLTFSYSRVSKLQIALT